MADFFDCVCPDGDLEIIVSNQCKTHRLPKVSRVHFQKFLTANNFINGANGIEEATSWTGITAVAGSTRVTVSPLVNDVNFGDAETIEGSENSDGATTITGLRPGEITVMIENPTPDQTKAINNLFCNDNGGFVAVAFVFANDSILVNEVTDTPVTHSFIRVSPETFKPGTVSREGALGSTFNFTFSFKVDSDWYDNSAVVKPETGFSYLEVLGV